MMNDDALGLINRTYLIENLKRLRQSLEALQGDAGGLADAGMQLAVQSREYNAGVLIQGGFYRLTGGLEVIESAIQAQIEEVIVWLIELDPENES